MHSSDPFCCGFGNDSHMPDSRERTVLTDGLDRVMVLNLRCCCGEWFYATYLIGQSRHMTENQQAKGSKSDTSKGIICIFGFLARETNFLETYSLFDLWPPRWLTSHWQQHADCHRKCSLQRVGGAVLMWAVTPNLPCELIGSWARRTTMMVTVESHVTLAGRSCHRLLFP